MAPPATQDDPLRPKKGAMYLIHSDASGTYLSKLSRVGSTPDMVRRLRKREKIKSVLKKFPAVIDELGVFTIERVMDESHVFESIVRVVEREYELKHDDLERKLTKRYADTKKYMDFIMEYGAALANRDVSFMMENGVLLFYRDTGEFVLKDHSRSDVYYALPDTRIGVFAEVFSDKCTIGLPKVVSPLPYLMGIVESNGKFHKCKWSIADYENEKDLVRKIVYYLNAGVTALTAGFYGSRQSHGTPSDRCKITKEKIGNRPVTNLNVNRIRFGSGVNLDAG